MKLKTLYVSFAAIFAFARSQETSASLEPIKVESTEEVPKIEALSTDLDASDFSDDKRDLQALYGVIKIFLCSYNAV